MFGKRGNAGSGDGAPGPAAAPAAAAPPPAAPKPAAPEPPRSASTPPPPPEPTVRRSENFYDIKTQIFSALIDTIDLSQLARLDTESAREEIRDIVNDIIALKNIVMSIAE